MEKNKQTKKTKIILASFLLLDIVITITAISTDFGTDLVIVLLLLIMLVLIERLSPIGYNNLVANKRVSNKVKYSIAHSDLELLLYSSKFRYFTEEEHPMDKLLNIDYKASYKRHYIRASIDEEAFVYHEETLFPTRKIPVINMFQGFVVEFKLPVRLNRKFTINHPLLDGKYSKNFLYTNGKTMRVYIPNRRFIEQITEKDDVEQAINDLTNNIKEIIQFKNEFLMTYKEDQL